MVPEPTMLGAVGTGLLGVLVVLRWWSRSRMGDARGALVQLAKTYVDSHFAILSERERRATMVAAIRALPPGACLIDRRGDGMLVVALARSTSAADQRPSSDEPDADR